MKAGYNYDETLQPHSDIYKLRNEEQPKHIDAEVPEPQELWYDDITNY